MGLVILRSGRVSSSSPFATVPVSSRTNVQKMLIALSDPQVAWLRERVGERARAPQQPRDDAPETARNTTNIVAEDRKDREDIEDREVSLTRDMEGLYYSVGRATGYWANRYLQAVRRKGGLACAKALLARPRSYGLERLMAEGRTDLSVEALVVDP